MKAKRLDYRTLAGLAGVSHAYLWQLANAEKRSLEAPGKPIKRPSQALALKIAEILELDPQEVLRAAGYETASEAELPLGITSYARIVPDAPRLFQQGIEETRRGNHDRAIVLLKQAIGHEGVSFLRAHMGLGVAYLYAGRYAPAIDEFSKAIALFDGHTERIREGVDLADAHYNRGLALQDSGSHANAIQDFRRALDLEGPHPDLYTAALCFSEIALGRYSRAIGAALEFEARPEAETAFTTAALDVRLYQAYALARKGQFEAALSLAQVTVVLCPGYWYSHYVMSSVLSRYGARLNKHLNQKRPRSTKQRLENIVRSGLRHGKRARSLNPSSGSSFIAERDGDFAFFAALPEFADLFRESADA
jgi:tetratricopeptide (TPR) repeat protein